MNFEISIAERGRDGRPLFRLRRTMRESDPATLTQALEFALSICEGWTARVTVSGDGRRYAYFYDFDEPNPRGSMGDWLMTRDPDAVEAKGPDSRRF